jgi:hypothetical protein
VFRAVVLCGSEVWTLRKSDENKLAVWERKIMRRIFGPVTENGVWRTSSNQELMKLYRETDVI